VQFRVPPRFGGGGNGQPFLEVPVLHDTGSSMQTLFDSDLQIWGFDFAAYLLHGGPCTLGQFHTANGSVNRSCIRLEMRVTDGQSNYLCLWTEIDVCIHPTPQVDPVTRLSGNEMRQHLFFAIGRGNTP